MKPYVYITRKVPESVLQPLQEIAEVGMWPHEDQPVPRDVLLKEAARAEGLFTMVSDQIDAEVLNAAPKLKVVANMAVGYDNIAVAEATEKDIMVCNTPDVLTDTTADLTFALLMASARRVVEASGYIRDNRWINWSPLLLAGHDIHHKTIGIVGMGRIGQATAKRATGFDMKILYHNRSRNEKAEQELGATYCSLDELLEQADFVVCLAPLTSETKALFSTEAFKEMKSSAIFINASRGGLVDEDALYDALKDGEIAGAGLDVFASEPIKADHPLLQFENVTALPHIGSASLETRMKMAEMTVTNIANVLNGHAPVAVVNEDLVEKKGSNASS
ncbi:2-hydroxyacid dehydrogenase [Desertibacillus haloalkaliphilus]|uniref:2-hydroxyacid dehydrogenase n=1 Tax=Desertibacillus haloalkaliphilus TaxID=1328930 RepID=UPI001C25DA69|nr:D-glycerate dehydrogenase [Desertibacillus haloalkaliphilus]MBU8909007.1 D-glycerate dehydrogenase [Desertibacillus haloalkaliphilus]